MTPSSDLISYHDETLFPSDVQTCIFLRTKACHLLREFILSSRSAKRGHESVVERGGKKFATHFHGDPKLFKQRQFAPCATFLQ